MVRVFSQALSADVLLRMQQNQYSDKVFLSDTVPANSSKLGKASVSTVGAFLVQFITGHYNTGRKSNDAAKTIDDSIVHLRGQLQDGNGLKKLFSDYVPFDLWLSPGATRNPLADNVIAPVTTGGVTYPVANNSNNLFYPIEFEYLFGENADILLDVKNDSDVALSYAICFHGIRIVNNRNA
jgi:hypothetical protein